MSFRVYLPRELPWQRFAVISRDAGLPSHHPAKLRLLVENDEDLLQEINPTTIQIIHRSNNLYCFLLL